MLIEFALCIICVIAAIDVDRVHISHHIWVDLPCRLLLAVLATGLFGHSITLLRDSRA